MNIQPLADNILLQPIELPATVGGILLPEGSREKTQQFRVVATGTKKACAVKVNDKVLIGQHAGTIITADGVEYRSLPESEILAIVRAK